MKKMKNVNANDRVVIDIIDRKAIQYKLVEAKTGKETKLGEPIEFSLSVKKFFGVNGKTIRELYTFNAFYNRKLETEMKRIWRAIEKKHEYKKQPVVIEHRTYEDERAA